MSTTPTPTPELVTQWMYEADKSARCLRSGGHLHNMSKAIAELAAAWGAEQERERVLVLTGGLKRSDWHPSGIFRHYYLSATGDYVNLAELRDLLAAAPTPMEES